MRLGQKYYRENVSRGQSPYPQVLENIYPSSSSAARQDLGVLEIPTDAIVGTLADGRKSAFAGNFMPLLSEETEFADKWISLCEAHLGDKGITDPVSCIEYMGRFYVQEGHKRVSVLRSYGSPSIQAKVTRIFPEASSDPAVAAYGEFLPFFKRSGIYVLQFTHPGCIAKIESALGFGDSHVWTEAERADFMSFYWVLREACTPAMLEGVRDRSLCEVLLSLLELYPYDQLKDLGISELRKRVSALMPDLRFAAEDHLSDHTSVSTEPEMAGKGLVRSLLDGISRPVLHVAFIHVRTPGTSAWTHGHDEGRKYLEHVLGSQVKVSCCFADETNAESLMEKAVTEDGANVIIATAPTLLSSARQCAAAHPGVKVLVCALSVPYVGVRTYYSRIHEANFISGAVTGSLCGSDPVGYIARYPILGTPASINAFALGVRLTNPGAEVILDWSCLEGDPVRRLREAGARIISGLSAPAPSSAVASPGWSTAIVEENGTMTPVASDVWNWGKTYEQIIRSILSGSWNSSVPQHSAVNYWWGMSSGVIDIRLSDAVPTGVRQLAGILKQGLVNETIHPFSGTIYDQSGNLRMSPGTGYTPESLMRMNWLCSHVHGRIPEVSELLPESRETSRLLALPEDFTGSAMGQTAQLRKVVA